MAGGARRGSPILGRAGGATMRGSAPSGGALGGGPMTDPRRGVEWTEAPGPTLARGLSAAPTGGNEPTAVRGANSLGAVAGQLGDEEDTLGGLLAPPAAPGELGRLGSYRILKVLG